MKRLARKISHDPAGRLVEGCGDQRCHRWAAPDPERLPDDGKSRLSRIARVPMGDVSASFVMEEIKDTTELPLLDL
ncbi:hypothetical protein [Roseovarius sp. D0-M9]|uniref:hypothetical protein n=1 Tax=Roseovarius sp. D0-M9 TaxID=3127117 RepID=UPI0030101882